MYYSIFTYLHILLTLFKHYLKLYRLIFKIYFINFIYMSDISDKKKVNYSTDYMCNYLQDSTKLYSPKNRKLYDKIKEEHNDDDSDDDINNYTTDKENNKQHDSDKSNNHHSSNKNIFEESFKFSKNETKEDDDDDDNDDNNDKHHDTKNKSNDLDGSYDNYNELSDGAKMLKRLDMLKKLGYLSTLGIELTQNYNINSDYFTMKYEYKLHKDIKEKTNFINWTSSILLNCVWGIEILNDEYNPFKLKLTNWSKQINADINDYYEVFGEIYETYNISGNGIRPEFKLLFMLGTSALKYHVNNSNKEAQAIHMGLNANIRVREDANKTEQLNNKIAESEHDFKGKMKKEHNQVNEHMNNMKQFQNSSNKSITGKKELDRKVAERFENAKKMYSKENNQHQNQNQNQNHQQQYFQNNNNNQEQYLQNKNTQQEQQINQMQQQLQEMQRMQATQLKQAQQTQQAQQQAFQTQQAQTYQAQQQNNVSPQIYEKMTSQNNKSDYEDERRQNVGDQLSKMATNMKTIIDNDDNDDNNEKYDNDKVYKNKANNVKNNKPKKKNKISVDTSSEESNKNSQESSSIISEEFGGSEASSNLDNKSKNTFNNNEIKELANKKKTYTKKKTAEASQNASTYSKRPYKKKPLSVNA